MGSLGKGMPVLVLGAHVLAACSLPAATGFPAGADPAGKLLPALSGLVDFGRADRQSAAAMSDVARAATVSLIDTSSTRTVATSVTDDAGVFTLSFSPGFVPAQGRVYALEGVKGLAENRPGSDAVRVRTLVRFDGGTWSTITAGRVAISPSTTALAVMQASYQAGNKAGPRALAAEYIDLIAGQGAPGSPDPLRAGQGVVDASTYTRVFDYVREALGDNQDPVAAISYKSDADSFLMQSSTRPVITGLSLDSGPAGTQVTLYGNKFDDANKDRNVVSFNGAAASVLAATKTDLTVVVPQDATSGPVTVTTDTGTSNEVPFRVVRNFGGRFLAGLRPGFDWHGK